jgi:hypothetical protein
MNGKLGNAGYGPSERANSQLFLSALRETGFAAEFCKPDLNK